MSPTIPMPKSLRATHPHLERFWPFIQMLRQESERGRVLISAGFLEEQLKDVLLGFMIDHPRCRDLLEGALGTFSARIEACYALGLITDDEHNDLTLIRRIRNEFAHNIDVSFETAGVVSRCGQLRMKDDVNLDSSGQFLSAAIAAISNLTNRPHFVSQERRVTRTTWPLA